MPGRSGKLVKSFAAPSRSHPPGQTRLLRLRWNCWLLIKDIRKLVLGQTPPLTECSALLKCIICFRCWH